MIHCDRAEDHEPGETCAKCGLEVDDYGNTEDDFLHCSFPDCSFPDCGCLEARLCMAAGR